MTDLDKDVVAEAVELSKAVFSMDRNEFEDSYGGELDSYIMVQDLENRIEEGFLASGGDVPYLNDLPSFSDFDYDPESLANLFYSVTSDAGYDDLETVSGISKNDLSDVLSDFEDQGLISSVEGTDGAGFVYGENAFAYLMVFSEADFLLGEDQKGFVEKEESEDYSDSENSPKDDEESEADDEESEKSLQDIMMSVADDDDDLTTTYEQKDDGGVSTRDHTDTDTEEPSNPNDDEYYEGW